VCAAAAQRLCLSEVPSDKARCVIRYRFNLMSKGSKCVLMMWRELSGKRYLRERESRSMGELVMALLCRRQAGAFTRPLFSST